MPNKKSTLGPILLSQESIFALSKILKEIEEKIERIYNQSIETKILSLKEMSYNKGVSNEMLSEQARSYDRNYTKVNFYTDDGYSVEFDELEKIMREQTLEKYNIKHIYIDIQRGNYTFQMSIQHNETTPIEYSVTGLNEDQKKNFLFNLNQWIRAMEPKALIRLWVKMDDLLKIFAVILLLLGGLIYISRNDTAKSLYQDNIKQLMQKQIEKGIHDQTDINNATNLMLILESSYVPQSYTNSHQLNTRFTTFFIICLGIFCFSFSPKTRFELGKEMKIYKFQVMWNKMIIGIPASIILPIAINLITK